MTCYIYFLAFNGNKALLHNIIGFIGYCLMFSQKKWGHSSSLGSHRLISELFRTWSTHQV